MLVNHVCYYDLRMILIPNPIFPPLVSTLYVRIVADTHHPYTQCSCHPTLSHTHSLSICRLHIIRNDPCPMNDLLNFLSFG